MVISTQVTGPAIMKKALGKLANGDPEADSFDDTAVTPSTGDRADQVDPILLAVANWHKHGWDSPFFAAALSIVRTEELIRQSSARSLRPHGLTHARHEALALLYFSHNGEMPLGKLSRRLVLHPTSVTSTVDTLERLGLAKRVAHPTDRRATLARITPKGRRAIEQSCQAIAASNHGLRALDESELETLFRILAKVRAAAGDIPDHIDRGALSKLDGAPKRRRR
jgi:DNA-binding MarR family transcriptional regulator